MKMYDLHFLVVEDDDFQRALLADMLRSLGATSISESGNGKEALEIIRNTASRPVDVALCDLKMPGMDGMEFLRHLGQEQHEVAIVITSSLDGKLLSSVGRMAKVHGIKLLGTIEKPIMLERLKELLKKRDQAEHRRQPPEVTRAFTLDDILQGIHANQFEPYFQPKVDFKTGRLVGAEALARWIHPEHGVITPDAFIPTLEQNGRVDDLTFLMLEKSALVCGLCLKKGYPLTISVNLSLVSLDNSELAERITRLIRSAEVDSEYIVLEVTESAAMTDVACALENLARLCMNGFSLSIDDYGTGYSSMQQLTRIAFSELKIDQSFVKDFADNGSMRIVVESSIDLAHKLAIKSIAEGVETQQDWDTLKSMGCDTAQGYFIAKPMNITAFQEFITSYSHKPRVMPTPARTDHAKSNILIVEDDNFTRKLIVSVLHHLGFAKITEADSAESAIKLLESNTFDLVITDINMPGMNGLQFIQTIRAGRTPLKRETRIVVLTALSQTEILAAALALDINGFLVKPITPAMVDEKIDKALSERLHLHPPLAYEAVRTELKRQPRTDSRLPLGHRGASIPIAARNGSDGGTGWGEHHVSLQRLRPGMILKEDIKLLDGTLLLSSGHVLSEASINRLYDIRSLLKQTRISIDESSTVGRG